MKSTAIQNNSTRCNSKVLKKLKVTIIKSENVVLMEVLTKKCHKSHHKKEIQEDDLEIKDPNLQQMYKGNHTPPHLVYNVFAETPDSIISYREPSNSPYY